MKGFLTIFWREVRAYFSGPMAWTVAGGFLFLSGQFFLAMMDSYVRDYLMSRDSPIMRGQTPDINIMMSQGVFPYLTTFLLFFTPLITMRLFTEERTMKTDELLFTSPVSTTAIVLGKYSAALFVVAVMLAGTLHIPAVLHQISPLDLRPLYSGYLGVFLVGAAFTSIGVFASSVTESQIVAALLSFVGLLTLLVLGWLTGMFEGSFLRPVIEYAAYDKHFENLSKGILDTRDIVYFVSLPALFLFATHRTLGTSQWRS
ncbi:MAG: ABC transporter permease subunit [Deltaproteobacteria bacterium]|nr:ABC transporter permease subunit [Deltaproteobacteria bacterium]